MYPVMVFLHVLGAFLFFMAHGATIFGMFRLRRDRDPVSVRTFLTVSTSSIQILNISQVLPLATGIIVGFMGRWWGQGWIWASLGLFIGISLLMSFVGASHYGRVRKAVGLPYFEGFREKPGVEPAPRQEVDALLDKAPVGLMSVVGFGGLTAILWLMMFKPF